MRYRARNSGGAVRSVELNGARELRTFGVGNPIWKSDEPKRIDGLVGAIVRLEVPDMVAPEAVSEVRRMMLTQGGAAAVKVVKKPPAVKLIQEQSPKKPMAILDAVRSVVAESRSDRKEELLELCEQLLARAGA